MNKHSFVTELDRRWRSDRRWQGITRTYTPEDVYRLRGTL
jgi:isocitrate lyase